MEVSKKNNLKDRIYPKDKEYPNYILFFLNHIINELVSSISYEEEHEFIVEVKTTDYPYCYDANEMIRKTIKRWGYKASLNHYSMIYDGDDVVYKYRWKIESDLSLI